MYIQDRGNFALQSKYEASSCSSATFMLHQAGAYRSGGCEDGALLERLRLEPWALCSTVSF